MQVVVDERVRVRVGEQRSLRRPGPGGLFSAMPVTAGAEQGETYRLRTAP